MYLYLAFVDLNTSAVMFKPYCCLSNKCFHYLLLFIPSLYVYIYIYIYNIYKYIYIYIYNIYIYI